MKKHLDRLLKGFFTLITALLAIIVAVGVSWIVTSLIAGNSTVFLSVALGLFVLLIVYGIGYMFEDEI